MNAAALRVPEHVRLAYVMRGGIAESVHHGSVVVLSPDGSVWCVLGDPFAVCYPRSALKPVQVCGMVRLGLTLPAELLALAAGSHSGQRLHVDGVRRILLSQGLSAGDMRIPIEPPQAGHGRGSGGVATTSSDGRLAHGCSGKHAAMLATARAKGWLTAGYLEPNHPVQRAIASTVEDLSDESIVRVAVDGCGAPMFAISLVGLARAIGRIAAGSVGSPLHTVAEAIRTHPEMVGGTGRSVTELIRAVPGLVAKDGVEGVQVAALPDGSAVAVKIADGSSRVLMAATAASLRLCGVSAEVLAPFVAGADTPVTEGIRLVRVLSG